MGATLPAAIQRELAAHYGVDATPDVDAFIEASDDDGARESLLVREDDGGLEIALRLPRRGLEAGVRLGLDLAAQIVEGVSHFLCLAERARRELPITQLELELQAEVDKYVTCLLVTEAIPRVSAELRARLFGDPCYEPDLDADERERYRAANDNAHRYTTWLEHAFVAPRRIPEMLGELRRFYRVGLAGKLAQIATLSRAA
ncbi:MAG TPA: hypothetical protein VGM56_11760 [Byssovorax sp.]